jgi:hypothetical protein
MPEIKPLRKSLIAAIILFILDAFILNQGVIAAIALLFVLFWFLPKALSLYFKKASPGYYLKKSLIYTIMAVSVLGANYLNNNIARQRAESLIAKIEKYKVDNGNYPPQLKELIPKYIDSVPVAKYALGFNRFYYINGRDDVLLLYVHFPPYGRPMYSFNRKEWTIID